MELITLDNDTFHIACDSKIIEIIEQIYKDYDINPKLVIQNYKKEHYDDNKEFIEISELFDSEYVYKIRKRMIENILLYSIEELHLYNEKVVKCLFDCVSKKCNPLKYDNYIASSFLKYFSRLSPMFIPEFMLFNKKDLNIYFITDKNKVYYYTENSDDIFVKMIEKNDTIEDAITECNYFANRNRIVTLANF